MRESASHDIVFDGVFVPDAVVIRVSANGETFVPSPEVAPWHGLPFCDVRRIAVAARDWVARFARRACRRTSASRSATYLRCARSSARLRRCSSPPRLVFDTARDWVEGRADRATSRHRCHW